MDTTLLGTSVALPQISRELKKIWETTGGTQTRASLMNFAVICPHPDDVEGATRLISDFTRDHSCRALLICREADAPAGTPVEAWINAHCHLPRAGAKHVCCEQVTLLLHSASRTLLLNTLFANLDSDLPLFVWWQGEIPHPIAPQFWTWVDRLLFDSREWAEPGEQFRQMRAAVEESGSRVILCDLNWTRTLHLRQVLAQMFDHPENLAQIPALCRLSLTHAPGSASTALLFAAWIAAQLRWEGKRRSATEICFRTRTGGTVTCTLQEAQGAAVSRVELSGAMPFLTVSQEAGAPFYQAEIKLPNGKSYQHLMPAGSEEAGELLSEEVSLGGRHRVYLKALETLRAFL